MNGTHTTTDATAACTATGGGPIGVERTTSDGRSTERDPDDAASTTRRSTLHRRRPPTREVTIDG